MIVPLAAGGGNDTLARIYAAGLSEVLGQQVIVENMPGGGGLTAALRTAKASPDGYQFILGNVGTHAYSQVLHKVPPYDAVADFTPVALIAELPLVLVARNDLPVRGLQEFATYVRANQTRMQYASAGAGTATHLGCVLLNAKIGVTPTHIPYRGGGPAMQDMLAGQTDYQCPTSTIAFQHIRDGQVRGIAILARQRSPNMPDLQTADEQGFPGFEASTWNAFFLPKGTPSHIVETLHRATIATMENVSVRQRLKNIGADVVAPERRSSDFLAKFVSTEIAKWSAPIRAAGLVAD